VSAQTAGLCLAAVGAALLWSEWALVIAGVLLILVPEVAATVRRGDRAAKRR
jgi:hypothetical protein